MRLHLRALLALIREAGRLISLRLWETALALHEPFIIDDVLPVVSAWCPACRTMAPCQPWIVAEANVHRLRAEAVNQ